MSDVSDKLRGKTFGVVTVRGPDGALVEVNPDYDLSITDDLSEEMRVQAGLSSWYASRAEDAQAWVKRLRFDIHCLEEDLTSKYRRAQADKPRGERLQPAQLKVEVKRDRRMRELYASVVEAERIHGKLNALVHAFRDRKDMLQSMGALFRQQGELRTMAGPEREERPRQAIDRMAAKAFPQRTK